MRKKKIHIALASVLLSSLLFGQLVVNLLHDRHDYHEAVAHSQNGDSLQKHGEHCKVCSLELISSLSLSDEIVLKTPSHNNQHFSSLKISEQIVFISLSQGRAPPALLF